MSARAFMARSFRSDHEIQTHPIRDDRDVIAAARNDAEQLAIAEAAVLLKRSEPNPTLVALVDASLALRRAYDSEPDSETSRCIEQAAGLVAAAIGKTAVARGAAVRK
jgi:hypothetical protein